MDTTAWVLPIATPYSTGTGFYLPQAGLIVTTEHLVRDNASAIVQRPGGQRQLLPIVYLDPTYDLAFLQADGWPQAPALPFAPSPPSAEEELIALGRLLQGKQAQSRGRLIDVDFSFHDLSYLRHDAWLDPIHSGGPLLTHSGHLRGMNQFDHADGRPRALALPLGALQESLDLFDPAASRSAARCFHCRVVNFEQDDQHHRHCINCGKPIQLPGRIADYQADGIQATIEDIIESTGYDPQLSRQGPNLWEIEHGSAQIRISYHEESGLLTGDAHLCNLPDEHPVELFEYLLRQNYELDQLTFSTWGRDIILSLLIYDRYLSRETALPQLKHLFERADYYDNVLVDKFGAEWN